MKQIKVCYVRTFVSQNLAFEGPFDLFVLVELKKKLALLSLRIVSEKKTGV